MVGGFGRLSRQGPRAQFLAGYVTYLTRSLIQLLFSSFSGFGPIIPLKMPNHQPDDVVVAQENTHRVVVFMRKANMQVDCFHALLCKKVHLGCTWRESAWVRLLVAVRIIPFCSCAY